LEIVETRDHVVSLDRPVSLGHQERVETMDDRGLQDHLDNPDNEDLKVYQEILEFQDTQV
jgi:hypothetical protein